MYTLERFREEMEKIGREEGLERGLEQGRLEGMYKTVKGASKLGMDAATIAATFEFDRADVDKALARLQSEQI